jgi:uncharacterized protein (DUF927 family)
MRNKKYVMVLIDDRIELERYEALKEIGKMEYKVLKVSKIYTSIKSIEKAFKLMFRVCAYNNESERYNQIFSFVGKQIKEGDTINDMDKVYDNIKLYLDLWKYLDIRKYARKEIYIAGRRIKFNGD